MPDTLVCLRGRSAGRAEAPEHGAGGERSGSPSSAASHRTCLTGGSARVIAPGTVWPDTRLQRDAAHQAIMARRIGGVVTSRPMSPKTCRHGVGTDQTVMTDSIGEVIAACSMPAETGEGAKGTLLARAWSDLHDQQEQEQEEEGTHGAIPPV